MALTIFRQTAAASRFEASKDLEGFRKVFSALQFNSLWMAILMVRVDQF